MERIERIHALHRILTAARYPVTVQRLQQELECSRATVYRDLAYLRDYLMAPVTGNGEAGFRYDASQGERFELPGLWLSSDELHSLCCPTLWRRCRTASRSCWTNTQAAAACRSSACA